MFVAIKKITKSSSALNYAILWLTFGLYVFIVAFTMSHHEPWGDEIHSWNIAKASGSFGDLISNIKYEGHPPLWYFILWLISKFTHNLAYVQTAHLLLATASVFILLFFSPFPFFTRLLMPFGYYFLFEYAIISRNYAVAVLLTFCICLIIRKTSRYKLVLYYLLFFLMTNTHLLAILLAISLHLYFLIFNFEHNKNRKILTLHVLLGIVILLPSVYFIAPPSDSQLNIQYWIHRWNSHQLAAFIQAPLFSFVPIPAWWKYNFWNTQFLIEAKANYGFLRFVNLLVAALLPLLALFILKRNKKALMVFGINFLLSFIIAVAVFPLTAERYAGFIFIGFVAAYWLYCNETVVSARNKLLFDFFLVIQVIGSFFIVPKDIRLPFSNAYRVNELLNEVPAGQKTVTDYWAMNPISAFADKPMYCIDLQKEISFVKWNSDLGAMQNTRYRYFDGVKDYFDKNSINRIYMLSTGSPAVLVKVDSMLFESYRVNLVDKREGAIEKGGNLYLYEINANSP
jgi:hypothetical protein